MGVQAAIDRNRDTYRSTLLLVFWTDLVTVWRFGRGPSTTIGFDCRPDDCLISRVQTK